MSDTSDGAECGSATDAMCAVYRHDVHKLRGRSHDAASREFAGVVVNEEVSRGADGDAALLSRPEGEPEQTVDNHVSPYRLSLLTGDAVSSSPLDRWENRLDALVSPNDPRQLHAVWLSSEVPAAFNESVYHPYTSLKFHVLLAAALLDNYRAGFEFSDLWLVATPGSERAAATSSSGDKGSFAAGLDVGAVVGAGGVVPHRTVLWSPVVSLRVTGEPGGRPAARLGGVPARSFADVWSRLPSQPLDVDGARRWRVLDAQLRRIRSWSTALQFIEDYISMYGSGSSAEPGRGMVGGGADGA